MYLKPHAPVVITAIINEMYYRMCIQNDTPQYGDDVLLDISNIQQQYAVQEEFELSGVVQQLYEEISIELETQAANNAVDGLISLLQ